MTSENHFEPSSTMREPESRKFGLFGKRSSGKSALINALLGRDAAAVKPTVEPTYQAMEIYGIGSVTLVDTAGLDSTGKRIQKTQAAAEKLDVALMLMANDSLELELVWMSRLRHNGVAIIPVISQIDKMPDEGRHLAAAVREVTGIKPIRVSAKLGVGLDELLDAMRSVNRGN